MSNASAPMAPKLKLDLLTDASLPVRGKLILVTATTPTVSGEGKTVTSIGLVQGLEKIGKKAIITSREPSLGPVFGMKGGAAGGGRSQVEPAEKINLHFHGDFHAITSAHNLLAALIDSHLFHGNPLDLDPHAITWPRTLDMNDRALRHIVVSVRRQTRRRQSAHRLCHHRRLARSWPSWRWPTAAKTCALRLGRIVIGQTRSGKPVLAKDLNATGPMMALLSMPSCPISCRPPKARLRSSTAAPSPTSPTAPALSSRSRWASASPTTSSTRPASPPTSALKSTWTSSCPAPASSPPPCVLVTTVQSVRNQGAGDLEAGFANLKKHIAIVRGFNLPAIVAINRFPNDTDEELKFLEKYCEAQGAAFALSEAFTKGGEGAIALAKKVVSVIAANPTPGAPDDLHTLCLTA